MHRSRLGRPIGIGLLGTAVLLLSVDVFHTPIAKADAPLCRYETSNVDVVVDKETGLTWQRAVDISPKTWDEAKTYCTGLKLSGTAWRLPTVQELHSLVDEKAFNPAIDAITFPKTPSDFFWSSSAVVGALGSAWGVSFHNGNVESVGVGSPFPIRCVHF